MKTTKPYEALDFGFDRTQLFKEFNQPQINRSTALQATMNWVKTNQIKLNLSEIIALSEKFVIYIEEGKTNWMKETEQYIQDKLQDTDGVLID